MIEEVLLKQMHPGVDLLPAQFVDHQMDRADPAVYSPGFLGHLIVNIAGLHDRLDLIAPTALGVQATLNSALAITQDLQILLFTRNDLLRYTGSITAIKPRI